MLGHGHFYFGMTNKMIDYFGKLFSDEYILRPATPNSPSELLKVPLSLASKDRLMVRADTDPELNKSVNKFPFMSFELMDFYRDANRHQPSTTVVAAKSGSPNTLLKQFIAEPWNWDFNLYVYSNKFDDGVQVVEQITPFFRPALTNRLVLIEAMNEIRDVPLVLRTVKLDDRYDGDFTNERRIQVWTLGFTMKGWMYSPVEEKKIVKFANTNFYVPSFDTSMNDSVGSTDMIGAIQVKPGLTANGEPTSNNSLSVNTNIITVDSNYGYIVTNAGHILTE